MVTKNIMGTYKKDTFDFIEMDTLTERIRRIRALNAKPSDIGLTQYTWKTFAIAKTKKRSR